MNNNTISKTKYSKKNKEGTPYAKFHLAFLGYNFLDKNTGKVLRKLNVFYRDIPAAMLMVQTKVTTDRYKLVDAPGWKNGKLINE